MFSARKKSNSPLSRVMRRLRARTTGAAVLSDGQRRAIRLGAGTVLLVACLLLLRGLLRLFFFGGPTVSAGISSKTTLKAGISGIGQANTVIDNYSKDVNNYGRFDVMLGGGMGFDFANRLRLTVGYDFGMLNRYTASATSVQHHRNQLHAGLAFLF